MNDNYKDVEYNPDKGLFLITDKKSGTGFDIQLSDWKYSVNAIMSHKWLSQDRLFLELHMNPSTAIFVDMNIPENKMTFYPGYRAVWDSKLEKVAVLNAPPHFNTPFYIPDTLKVNKKTIMHIPRIDRELTEKEKEHYREDSSDSKEKDEEIAKMRRKDINLFWSADGKLLTVEAIFEKRKDSYFIRFDKQNKFKVKKKSASVKLKQAGI